VVSYRKTPTTTVFGFSLCVRLEKINPPRLQKITLGLFRQSIIMLSEDLSTLQNAPESIFSPHRMSSDSLGILLIQRLMNFFQQRGYKSPICKPQYNSNV